MRRSYIGTGNPNYGKHHSLETRLAISYSHKGILDRVFCAEDSNRFEHLRTDEIITGLMLSDGYLTDCSKGHSMFRLDQSLEHKELVFATARHFHTLGFRVRIRLRERFYKGKVLKNIYIWTNANGVLTHLRNYWYPDGIKRPPKSLVLTPRTLAYWFMGDGCSGRTNQGRSVTIHLATHGFTQTENEYLKQLLHTTGFFSASIIHYHGFYIQIARADDVKRFMHEIVPHILADFKYKIKLPLLFCERGQPQRKMLTQEKLF